MRFGDVSHGELHRRNRAAVSKAIRTGMPGVIQSFDSKTQLADVLPGLSETEVNEDGSQVVEKLNIISSVPVRFPGGGGHSATFPVKQGDECWLEFADREIDKWIDNGGQVNPNSVRRHHIKDAVCLTDLRSKPNAIPNFDTEHTTIGDDSAPSDQRQFAARLKDAVDAGQLAMVAATPLGFALLWAPPGTSAPATFPAVPPWVLIGSFTVAGDVTSTTVAGAQEFNGQISGSSQSVIIKG